MAAILKPNIPYRSTTATSFTIGLAIRKLSVTPSGTPAATKPMKAGTALQEQNGVATPSPAAAMLPRSFPLAAEQGAGALDREEAAQQPRRRR